MTRRRPSIATEALRHAEQLDELLAPAIQRTAIITAEGIVLREPLAERDEWVDPDDNDPRARAPRKIRGFRRVDVMRNLHLRSPHDFMEEHLKAASRLSDDFELKEGARPGYERSEVRNEGQPDGLSQTQLDAFYRYRKAIQAVGMRLAFPLQMVVLTNTPLAEVARLMCTTSDTAKGYLLAALDRLRDHYEEIGDRRNDDVV